MKLPPPPPAGPADPLPALSGSSMSAPAYADSGRIAVASARAPASAPWPYLAAAAVLTDFAPESLRPLGGGKSDIAQIGTMCSMHGVPIRSGPAKGRWSLSGTSRRAVLADLARRGELPQALAANQGAGRPDNPVQQQLDALLQGRLPHLADQSLDQLLGLERALDFLGPAAHLPQAVRVDVLARIQRLRLLEPLQRLVAQGFAGRTHELQVLRTYVDDLPSQSFTEWLRRKAGNVLDAFRHRPPLVVWGPGGVGKSTLLARFLLDHAGPQHSDPTPFVYLDFDSGQLDPAQPDTLLLEAFRQIQLQFPGMAGRAQVLAQDTSANLSVQDNVTPSRSAHYDQSARLRAELVGLLREISAAHGKNFLLFVDTFEVVQRRGATPVFNVLKLGAELLHDLPRLRLVIAGRAALREVDFSFAGKQPAWQALNLQGFDAEAGRAYLARQVSALGCSHVPERVLDRIVALVHGNALSLRLAAQVFAKQADLGALEDTVAQAVFEAQFTHERVQGMLHSRIVANLEEPLRRIADPGLIVRRITPQVIDEVLAGPCGLGPTWDSALLLQGLQQEVALVEPVGADAVRHRPDVRLLMLPLLRAKLGPLARAIDAAAVAFWSRQEGPEARAEEIYHRLWLGADAAELDEAWRRGPVARPPLEEALDEFEALDESPAARIWLCGKLQREISPVLEQAAGLIDWERSTELRVRALLASGGAKDALATLRRRPERRAASPLWLLELETLKLLGQDAEALSVAERALAVAEGGPVAAHVLALLLAKVGLLERVGGLLPGLEVAARAALLARALGDRALEFEALLMQARLARKAGRGEDEPDGAALRQRLRAGAAEPAVMQVLKSRPALLGEAAAEIGDLQPGLFIAAAERFSGLRHGGRGVEGELAWKLGLGVAHGAMWQFEPARELLQQVLSRALELRDPAPWVRRATLQLANVWADAGAYGEAAGAYQSCLDMARKAGLKEWEALAQQGLEALSGGAGAVPRPGVRAELVQLREAARAVVDQLIHQTLRA